MSSGTSPGTSAIGSDDEVGLVLGLESADVEEVAAGLDVGQSVTRQVRRWLAVQERGAVGDERGRGGRSARGSSRR